MNAIDKSNCMFSTETMECIRTVGNENFEEDAKQVNNTELSIRCVSYYT